MASDRPEIKPALQSIALIFKNLYILYEMQFISLHITIVVVNTQDSLNIKWDNACRWFNTLPGT